MQINVPYHLLLVIVCIVIVLDFPSIAAADSILRDDPRLPLQGTRNWKLLEGARFSPRHSHATTVFPCPDDTNDECLWLTGGYSELHRTFDVKQENENNDVWFSKDGATWNQVTEIHGDFLLQGVGNGDAKIGGYAAPWYSRYGHSLNALDGDGDGVADVMVLAGGNSPIPSNDVWITMDGITWKFNGYAPWSKRAYHGAAVFQDKLWVLGGTQLSNDVWAGSLVKGSSGYKLVWEQMLPAPWTPRAGHCVLTQLSQETQAENDNENATETLYKESMFVIGGLALAEEGSGDGGTRARNDVWKTEDGVSWEQVVTSSNSTTMPFEPRVFHSCVTWHSLEDKSRWVGVDSKDVPSSDDEGRYTQPRMFITGGGYLGRKGNRNNDVLEAYTDTWWSHDGADWVRVDYEEGSKHKDNLYSTNEWTETIDQSGRKIYRGKWGHRLEAFHTSKELDDEQSACTATDSETICEERKVPALFVIGGKLESESLVNDVFISQPGIHCEINGITCSENGFCGPENQGCIGI